MSEADGIVTEMRGGSKKDMFKSQSQYEQFRRYRMRECVSVCVEGKECDL